MVDKKNDDKKPPSPRAIGLFAVLLIGGGFLLYRFVIWLMTNAFRDAGIPIP